MLHYDPRHFSAAPEPVIRTDFKGLTDLEIQKWDVGVHQTTWLGFYVGYVQFG